MPALNTFASPVKITQRKLRSFLSFSAVRTNSLSRAKLMALRLSGRFRETVAMPLFFSIRSKVMM